MTKVPNIKIEGARLCFKNFGGVETEFNPPGKRNFGVMLDDDLAEELERDGWNVKRMKPRPDDPEEHRQPYMKINVQYGKVPPVINLITRRGMTKLFEEDVQQLDYSKIANADLVIRPYEWEKAGRSGISAYLKSLYVTVEEDELDAILEDKYADVPMAEPRN